MSTIPQPPVDEFLLKLRKRIRNLTLSLIVASTIVIALSATFGTLGWRKLNAIGKTEDDIQFNQFVSDFNIGTDYVQPAVNTIQFLHHGYSIVFDSVQYTQEGLALDGKLGKPTNRSIGGQIEQSEPGLTASLLTSCQRSN